MILWTYKLVLFQRSSHSHDIQPFYSQTEVYNVCDVVVYAKANILDGNVYMLYEMKQEVFFSLQLFPENLTMTERAQKCI